MTRSYKHIRRDNARKYPHQVRLTHARLWRMDRVDAQLRYLEPRQWAWWHEGDERRGDDVGIWGFKCPCMNPATSQAPTASRWPSRVHRRELHQAVIVEAYLNVTTTKHLRSSLAGETISTASRSTRRQERNES